MNTDFHEQDYECITLLKGNPNLFTYDPQNDIYFCKQYQLAIGNKEVLQSYIERTCKSRDRKNIGTLFNGYSRNEILAAIYNNDKSRCNILPAMLVIKGKNILEQELHNKREIHMQDKFIAGTVEAQYDNYLSAEESADLYEKENKINDEINIFEE